ncbi:MAG: hypothetical protein JW950_11175 [Deltaproteobacteria bacterium]|nr:hypothetical protein [Deltaproteobacteria bacterium]
MAKEADHVAGAALLLILAVMAVSSVFEALEDRLGTMLMNCVISIPSVPLLPAANIGCMFFGADAWNLKQKTMCIGAQVPALALAFLHFLFTKKLWKREPPLRLQPKTPSQPYKPDLAGPVKWAFAYLTVVLFAAGLCGLVPAKRVFSNRDIPVFWLTTVLLIVLIAAACAILPLIDRKLSRR